jgi:thymidylate synthase
VITDKLNYEVNCDCIIQSNLDNALHYAYENNFEEVYVIGGSKIYNEALTRNDIKYIYITIINNIHECDRFFNKYDIESYNKIILYNDADTTIVKLMKKNYDELAYLDLLKNVLINGNKQIDRTGTGTISMNGLSLKFDLSKGYPLLTTKKMWFKGILIELLWFISGSTNVEELQNQKLHIWDGNSSREFLDKRGLYELNEGDIGPSYGFQFKHFGAKYINNDTNYSNQGMNQIDYVINELKNNPISRQIVINLWNSSDIHKMALPPCLMMYNFFVNINSNKLDCVMYARSSDLFLGNPWNIGTGALLTYILAHICNMNVGELTFNIGNAHIYNNHINQCIEQIDRIPYVYPQLKINKNITNIYDLKVCDFELCDYMYYPAIKGEMSI